MQTAGAEGPQLTTSHPAHGKHPPTSALRLSLFITSPLGPSPCRDWAELGDHPGAGGLFKRRLCSKHGEFAGRGTARALGLGGGSCGRCPVPSRQGVPCTVHQRAPENAPRAVFYIRANRVCDDALFSPSFFLRLGRG